MYFMILLAQSSIVRINFVFGDFPVFLALTDCCGSGVLFDADRMSRRIDDMEDLLRSVAE
jgi:hypothetical protein